MEPAVRAAELVWEVPFVEKIVLDAALSDWNGVPYKAQTPFRPCFEDDEAPENHFEGTKNVVECSTGVEFETYGGGIWNGPHDQASAIALGWTANVLYIAAAGRVAPADVLVRDRIEEKKNQTVIGAGGGDRIEIFRWISWKPFHTPPYAQNCSLPL